MKSNLDKTIIGTWPLCGDFGNIDLITVQETLSACFDAGFREFDTAPNYGDGFMEFALGKVFNGREKLRLNTKVGNFPFEGKRFDLPTMKKSLHHSISRLRQEQIHTLFLHNPRTEIDNYDEILDWLETLKSEGTIVFHGISLAKNTTYNPDILSQFDIVQEEANLLNLDILFSDQNLKALVVRSPLASGLLGGHINSDTTFPADDHRSGWLKGERLISIIKRVEILNTKAMSAGLSLATMSKLFLLQQTNATGVIFGVKNVGHVTSLTADLNLPPISEELATELVDLYKNDFGLIEEKHLGY